MKRQTIILILTMFLFSSLISFSQRLTENMTIGLNLPPLIGKTLDFKIETYPAPHFSPQFSLGIMINNRIKGSWYMIGDNRENWKNSGAFLSCGLRYNFKSNYDKSTFFIGTKLIGGYFDQTANTWDGEAIYKTGFFAAVGIESGFTFKISQKLYTDFGFQISPLLYSDQQVSNFFSVLPGIGAIGNLQGILSIKYLFNNKTVKKSAT